jgi:hypothetical protein
MTGYVASCPACGAEIVFQLGSSLLKVCDHCGVAVARQGVDLKAYGRVAQLLPTNTVLRLGLDGRFEGAPAFTLVGRLQLSTGEGSWDEWLMGFADEAWAWLSESQGRFHYLVAAPLPPVPSWGALRPGQTVDLGPSGIFVVSEVREGTFASAQGELPFDVEPGSPLRYADLSGPGGGFGTLDYGSGEQAEALYVGREVTLAELGFRDLPDAEERRVRARGGAMSCPQCAGPIELKAPDRTERVGCPWCGSLLDATKDLAVLSALAKVPIKPLIPLGSTGQLRGVKWSLIGFLERSATVEGVRYPWREYLLYEPRHGFRWLVEYDGHWSYVEEVPPAEVREANRKATYKGERFSHFQSSNPTVDHVVGEFYWAVSQGDQVTNVDYVSPPRLLSKEEDQNEVHWSLATYLTPNEIKDAFSLPALPRDPVGVGANQPWPHAEAFRSAWKVGGLAAVLLFVLFVMFAAAGGAKVHTETIVIPPTAVPATPEAATFTTPFVVSDAGNLQVRVDAPVDNSWLYLDAALINDDSGEIDEFDLEPSYYSGVDGGESWTEGSTSATTYVGSVTPGKYVIRFEPQWDPAHRVPHYTVAVRSRVARFSHFLLAALAVLVWPLILSWRRFRFEYHRWSQSDHPWSSE